MVQGDICKQQHFRGIKNELFFKERRLVDFKEPGDMLITGGHHDSPILKATEVRDVCF